MVIFNDFSSAKEHLQTIIYKNFDEYTVYTSHQYRLAIAVDLQEYSKTQEILEKFDNWTGFHTYNEIYIGVNDSRGWAIMNMPKKTKGGCLDAIERFEGIFKEFDQTDLNNDIEGKFLRMQYSLALAYYNLASYCKDDKQNKYITAINIYKIVIKRNGEYYGKNKKI